MSGIKQIFKKEMDRIFRDRKMIFSVFLLPVLVMVIIMSIVNNLATDMENDIESHVPVVFMANEPESFHTFIEQQNIDIKIKEVVDKKEMKHAKEAVLEGKADLIIEFPAGFNQLYSSYKEGDVIPQIKTYYNPSEEYSKAAYDGISTGTLEMYRQVLLSERVGNLEQVAVFTVNTDNEEMIIQDEKKAGGKAIGMMLPYFITILLFAGAMGIGTDMIAGEKERGTMASLLVSPIKRSSIALGKVFSLMSLSGISSIIYVGALVLFAPMMMQSMSGESGGVDISLTPQQIVMLGALLIAIAFLYSSIIALVSVFAKSTKEASTYVMPVYMLVLVVGLLTMFNMGGGPDTTSFFIPLYNTALVLQGILSQEVTMMQYGITLAETLVIGVVMLVLIVKAFESEKVMSA